MDPLLGGTVKGEEDILATEIKEDDKESFKSKEEDEELSSGIKIGGKGEKNEEKEDDGKEGSALRYA